MSAVASIEELNREYRARLAEAAKATYRNEDLLADWINAAKNEIMRTSLQGWRQCSGHLLEYLQQTGLHVLSITRTEAQAFIKWVETAPYKGRKKVGPLRAGSVLQHVLVGSSLFNYLRDVRGLVTTNPFFPLIKTFKKKRRSELRPKLRALFANEVPLALEGAETLDDYLLVLTPIKTGVRREEYATLRMDKINWKERSFEVEPHPRRTHLTAYFDEELEFFLKLKCQRNERDYPGNPYLNPSPQGEGKHVNCSTLNRAFRTIIDTSPLKATITSRETNLTLHSERRGFTSELKSRGCPSHIVAVLRGDSLLSRNELTPDPTQGIYTRFQKIDGKDELRIWYDRCMPRMGAREMWERKTPRRVDAKSVDDLLRLAKTGAV